MSQHLFTSESVTEGHPDKVCDQISDAVLDDILARDPQAHVACETIATTGLVVVMGEITASCSADIPGIARRVIRDIGYDAVKGPAMGFDGNTCRIELAMDTQSPDIAQGVHSALEARDGQTDPYDVQGAGDQGMMFGYACDETPEKMPLPISLAHRLARRLAEVRKTGMLNYLRPDGKTQVTVAYEGHRPVGVDTVLVSTQHDEEVDLETIRRDLEETVICPVIPAQWRSARTRVLVNPTGRFVIGGPHGDSGLTGRKLIVDTYGGYARHGGGAFSGKDPSKVDRSAAYMARYVAKQVVAAGLAARCEIQVAYAIGVARPVSVMVDTFGTGIVDDERLSRAVTEVFDFRPAAIIDRLDLRRPQYLPVAAYGHFGREDLDVAWERVDGTEKLKDAVGK